MPYYSISIRCDRRIAFGVAAGAISDQAESLDRIELLQKSNR